MEAQDFQALHGQAVLVVPPENVHRNPPVGVRGTLLVKEVADARDGCVAEISISMPDMFSERAQEKVIRLTARDLENLLRTDHHGGYVLALNEDLNPSVRLR